MSNKTATQQAAAPMKFEEVSALEIPTYSIKSIADGDTVYVQAMAEVITKPDMDRKTNKQKENKDGTPSEISTLHVVDSNGVEGEMVLPFLINRAMATAGTSGALVGRWFKLDKIRSETGKTTHWAVREVKPA